jgi:hypothetical protein
MGFALCFLRKTLSPLLLDVLELENSTATADKVLQLSRIYLFIHSFI